MASINLQGDTSGSISISAPSVAGSNTLTLPATTQTLATQNALGVRNLIINGDMKIDQRNAGSAATINTTAQTYVLDRWRHYGVTSAGAYTVQQNAGSVTPPSTFSNYLGITTTTADASPASGSYYFLSQLIEGFNTSHLQWGTANAKTITLSFYVRSSLTGTFGGSLCNAAFNRSYPFTYTINSANTWEQKSITIAGDTTGTWIGSTNGIGIALYFNLGSGSSNIGTANAWASAGYVGATGDTSVIGTSGATFYITGVQLEVGDTATPFEHRPYDMELSRCWRYFYSGYAAGEYPGQAGASVSFQHGSSASGTWCGIVVAPFPTQMRSTPTVIAYSPNSGASGKWYSNNTGTDQTANASGTTNGFKVSCQGNSPASPNGMQVNFTASAEL